METNLRIDNLSIRHPGVTRAIGDSYTEAATVCLHRHHDSTPLDIAATLRGARYECLLEWQTPDVRTQMAWANELDTTEAGAYGMSLAAVEELTGLVAIARAETLTGADYYVAPLGSDPSDLENCFRLEVSGVSSGSELIVQARLRAKLAQAAKGASNLPALASVVGFKERVIMIAEVGAKL